ncbi:MAG: pyridoxal phosphate-dependent aminotransferase [Fibrobacter sp.]|nr:pyridoxal phosphate-dependent aminotransferase [Fibrobacter sp.]
MSEIIRFFSSRLPKDLNPSPFFAELEAAKAEVRAEIAACAERVAGAGVATADAAARKDCANFIDMTVSSPLRVGLPFNLQPAVDDARHDFGSWVADAAGRREAREAVAEYYRERGGWFSAEQILLTASTSEAYSILFKTFCDPGDAILTPMPGYPLLDTLAQLEHLECYPYFLELKREERKRSLADLRESVRRASNIFRFAIDTDSFLSAPDNAKILLLVSPHNPTGHCVSEKEWNEIVSFCEQRNMVLVVDEVFGDYAIDPKVRRSWEYIRRETTNAKGECCGAACGPIAEPSIWQRSCKDERRESCGDGRENGLRPTDERRESCEDGRETGGASTALPKCPIFWLNGLSKTVGSPQLKLGWMAFYAPEEQFEPIRAALEFVADAYLSVSAQAQALARPMLKHATAYEAAIRERLLANWATLRAAFPSKYCPEVLGGWYAAVRLGDDDEQLTLRLLREKHVLVQPGFFFDFDEDGWVVVSLLQPSDVFAEAVLRLKELKKR